MAIVAVGIGVLLAARVEPVEDAAHRQRRRWRLGGCLLALAVALTWPVGDLAAHWSLTALVVQRVLLTVVGAPLLLLAISPAALARLTRPPWVDRVFAWVTRPAAVVVVFALVTWISLLPVAVRAQAVSGWARAGIDVGILAGGCLLWAPVLRHIPGASRVGAVGTAAYLFVQSVVPGFPSVLYILARHPFYASFAGVHRAFAFSALTDQQVAGVVGKVATLPVLWNVAWVVLTRAQRAAARGTDPDPLDWLDVERRLARGARRQRRSRLRPARFPAPVPRALPVVYPPDWGPDDDPSAPSPSPS